MKPEQVSPGILGLIHRRIGPIENVNLTGFVPHENHHAYAGRTVMPDRAICLCIVADGQQVGLRQADANFLGDEPLGRHPLVARPGLAQSGRIVSVDAVALHQPGAAQYR
jgi:hypothetical protein